MRRRFRFYCGAFDLRESVTVVYHGNIRFAYHVIGTYAQFLKFKGNSDGKLFQSGKGHTEIYA